MHTLRTRGSSVKLAIFKTKQKQVTKLLRHQMFYPASH
jgi:hypothetical protein